MAHSYAHLYGLPCTGLRFFTVYGPWGRPDMAYFKFTRAMLAGETIDVYGEGKPVRDFTYIDDIVEGVLRALAKPATPQAGAGGAPYRIFNIGGGAPVALMDFIEAIESALGLSARKRFLPMQPGDVFVTAADTSALAAWIGFVPATPVREGVARFVRWYRAFYRQ
jgi:UDP-glucuronate 4-epimerase